MRRKASLPGLAIIWGFFAAMSSISLGYERLRGRKFDRAYVSQMIILLLALTAVVLFVGRPAVPPFGF